MTLILYYYTCLFSNGLQKYNFFRFKTHFFKKMLQKNCKPLILRDMARALRAYNYQFFMWTSICGNGMVNPS